MTTLTLSSPGLQAERLADLPTLPLEGGEPIFAEPWQAQAFALAVKLSAQGYFTWKEWAATLADEINQATNGAEPDDGSKYYHHWLGALERLVSTKGLSDPESLLTRKIAWADAYRHTPHGKPVTLALAMALEVTKADLDAVKAFPETIPR